MSPDEASTGNGLPVAADDEPLSERDVERPATSSEPTEHLDESLTAHTRTSGYWAAVVVGLLVLLALVLFILENGQHVDISFVGQHARLPEGVALLLAAVIGGLVVVFVGTARIIQLRTRGRRLRSRRRL